MPVRHIRLVLLAAAAASLCLGGAALAATTRQATITAGGSFDAAKPGYQGLVAAPGQRQLVREMATARAQPARTRRRSSLIYLAHLSDLHVIDEESPARIDWLAPVQPNSSAQRPQEALTALTVDAVMRNLGAFTAASPNAAARGRRAQMALALSTGDQTDNHQENEVVWTRQLLEGGQLLDPNSGTSDLGRCTPGQRVELAARPRDEASRYTGLQDRDDFNGGSGDPNFYDPDMPAGRYGSWPRYPGLLDTAQRPFVPVGLRRGGALVPTYVADGNHDVAVQGYVTATQPAEQLATGCFKPYSPNPATNIGARGALATQEGFPVPPDPRRRFVGAIQAKRLYSGGAQRDGHGFAFVDPAQNAASAGTASYYAWSPRPGLRFVSLDTAAEGAGVAGGAEGNIDNPQFEWLRAELNRARARKQLVVVFGHHPTRRLIVSTPDEAAGGCSGRAGCDPDPRNSVPVRLRGDVERLFNATPNVVAYLSGHTHVNRIRPCASRCPRRGNWWSIETTSSIDWPQQQRLVEVMDNRDGTLSVLGTQVDHAGTVTQPAPTADEAATRTFGVEALASMSRSFSFNDPRALRSAAGGRGDRNVELIVRDPRAGRGAGLCAGVARKIAGRTVNRATLGRSRARVRRAFTRYSLRAASGSMDRRCMVGGGYLRIGYARGRSAIALSSSRSNRLARLRIGSRTRTVRRRLRGERRVRVGKSTVYLARASKARIVIQVRGGRVRQLGLASKGRTASRRAAQKFLDTFL